MCISAQLKKLYFCCHIISAVARANEVRGHKPKVGGGALKWTELLHIKTDILRLQNIMHYFKNFAFMFEKRDVQVRQRLLARFVYGPHNHLKNMSAAVNASRSATRIMLKWRELEPKKKFFLTKIV